ncbi:MAG: hypothetical protein QOJ96_738 [Alphaproteobacteria bacterium]|nr:hypothetical protein [Alphaproteobacteria bacterium]
MSAVKPAKWGLLAGCVALKLGWSVPSPHGKDTREPSPEVRTRRSPSASTVRWHVSVVRGPYGHVQDTRESIREAQAAPAVRCCCHWTPRRWGHERASSESAHETQAPAARSKASARAGLAQIGTRPHEGNRSDACRGWSGFTRAGILAALGRTVRARAAWAAFQSGCRRPPQDRN